MIIDVKIHPAIREFLIATNSGSDLLVPPRKSLLWQLVLYNLKTVPEDYRPVTDREDFIRIRIPDSRCRKILARKMRGRCKNSLRFITVNTQYRSYLDSQGQNIVASHLRRAFKECFHNFMLGSTFDNAIVQQKKAIETFCAIYGIPFDRMNYEMLVKSWMRSPQYARLKGKIGNSPLNF